MEGGSGPFPVNRGNPVIRRNAITPKDAELPAKSDTPLEKGRDYYLDAGVLVFTARYLSEQGSCCEQGCRHCPYGYDVRPEEKR